jgi:hypothetical protein
LLIDDLYQRGLEDYASRWFDPLSSDRVLEEKSTNQLESPLVAQRIQEASPEVRLIPLLRHPVERAY